MSRIGNSLFQMQILLVDAKKRNAPDVIVQAFEDSVEALEQESVLDKIRAEIDGLTYYWCEVNPRSVIDDVLDIIDKYKAESEE